MTRWKLTKVPTDHPDRVEAFEATVEDLRADIRQFVLT